MTRAAMKDILAKANAEVLAQFAWSKVLLAFDYDGTLAPIVDTPDDARLRARTRELLTRVCRLYPCIIISGRAQTDVLKRVRGVGVQEVIGNHGLEPWKRSEEFARTAQAWLPALTQALAPYKGVTVEDKLFSLAVHYRHSREKKLAQAAILEAAEALGPLRVIRGKQVVNLIPPGAPHKGMALQASRDRLGCDTALYVGDDVTDEDVFGLDEPGRLLGIRVGRSEATRAAFYLRAQRDIDALLELLVSFRAKSDARARSRADLEA